MNRQLVLYFDNCVFSELLKPDAAALRESLATFPHRIAFSDVHICEMWRNHEDYSALLNELDAVFVRNPGQAHNRHDVISSLEPALPEERFADHLEFLPIYNAFEAMFAPMHHLLGGKRDKSMGQIAKETEAEISAALKQLLNTEPSNDFTGLYDTLEKTTEGLAFTEVSDGWTKINAQVAAARQGDPMRAMNPLEKVYHVLSKLDETERQKFIEEYPEKFAQLRLLNTGELTGFASALFGMGLTKQKGLFSGPRQKQKFAAQFRDAQHIEEASRCDWFVTFDQGANELAASTFAYSGFPTQTVLLKNTGHAPSRL